MKKIFNRKSIIFAVLSAALFIFLLRNYEGRLIEYIDLKTLDWLIGNTKDTLVLVFEVITLLASWQVILLFSLFLILVGRDKFQAILVGALTLFSWIIVQSLKNGVVRPRPEVFQLADVSGYSFPSGHAAIAMVFYGLLVVFYLRRIKKTNYRVLSYILVFALVALIGLSRIYLRVHFVSDVLAGLSLGIFIISMVVLIKGSVFDNIHEIINKEGE